MPQWDKGTLLVAVVKTLKQWSIVLRIKCGWAKKNIFHGNLRKKDTDWSLRPILLWHLNKNSRLERKNPEKPGVQCKVHEQWPKTIKVCYALLNQNLAKKRKEKRKRIIGMSSLTHTKIWCRDINHHINQVLCKDTFTHWTVVFQSTSKSHAGLLNVPIKNKKKIDSLHN